MEKREDLMQPLYEDNHVIAIVKPAGMPVQGEETGAANLMDEVKRYLKEHYRKPGNVFLGLAHRLDRPVSGIVIFGKTSKGAARLSEQFRNRTAKKIYHAVVIGALKAGTRGTLTHYLQKDAKGLKARVFTSAGPNRKYAELAYKVISSKGNYSFLRIELATGRFHQIRAQLAAIQHPIAGDVKYGALAPLPDQSIALAATELHFKTATTNEEKVLRMDPPSDWQRYL